MMVGRVIGLSLWVCAAIILGCAYSLIRVPGSSRVSTLQPGGDNPASIGQLISGARVERILEGLTNDPFHNGMDAVASPAEEVSMPEPPPTDPIEGMKLVGTIGGPPWQAIMSAEGMGSRVIMMGDSIAAALIVRVERDSVIVRSAMGLKVIRLDGGSSW